MNEQLQALQQAIQVLHQLMTILDDPNDTRVVAQCLSALTGIQRTMMANMQQAQQGGGQQQGGQNPQALQALVQQLQGAQQGGQ